jgi:hypothetical protein
MRLNTVSSHCGRFPTAFCLMLLHADAAGCRAYQQILLFLIITSPGIGIPIDPK